MENHLIYLIHLHKAEKMTKKLPYEYLLIIIAILWAATFSFVLQISVNHELKNDEVTYLDAAKLLYFDNTLDNTRPLLISTIVGLPCLFGSSDQTIITFGFFINFFSWLFSIVLVYKILCLRLSRKMAFVFAVFFIFCIGNLAHSFRLLSESVFIFLIVLAVYFLSKYYQTTKTYFITIALSILLLNSLIKPVSIGFAFILLLFYMPKYKQILINRFSILLVMSVCLIMFQMYSLKKTYGDFTISYISAFTYYNYLGAKADCIKKNIEYIPGENLRTKKFNLLSSHEMKQLATKDFISQLKTNKINLIKAYLFCIYSNSTKGNLIVSNAINEKNTFYFDAFRFIFKAVSKLQNIIFTLCAVILSVFTIINFRKQNQFYILIAFFILYIFFISAISCFECDRFHIAFFPLLIVLFSIYIPSRFLKAHL